MALKEAIVVRANKISSSCGFGFLGLQYRATVDYFNADFGGIVFVGKDSSRALACSSLKPEDCRPEWDDLGDKEKGVLEDWFKFFSKRYNIVGKVEGAANL